MIQNKAARNQLGSFDHMLLLPSLLQSDIQWHFGAAKLEVMHYEQRFDYLIDGQYENSLTLDF